MHLRLLLTFGCLGCAVAAWADAPVQIQPGQWQFVAERDAEIRALGLKKHDHGESLRCLSAEPLVDLTAWLGSKGCTVTTSRVEVAQAHLTGSCEFKFLPGQTLPMRASLKRESATRFTLALAAGKSGLGYRETTTAERVGACPGSAEP